MDSQNTAEVPEGNVIAVPQNPKTPKLRFQGKRFDIEIFANLYIISENINILYNNLVESLLLKVK